MSRICLRAIGICLCCSSAVWATSTGLNNIPTADVVTQDQFVVQYFSHVGNDRVADHFLGFKYGPLRNVEIGLDGHIFPSASRQEHVAAQGKWRWELSNAWALAAGLTNLGNHARSGREYPFLVFSGDLGLLRAHVGGTVQKDNEGFFGGLDTTLSCFDRDLTLRADIQQTNNGHDILSSVGFLYDLGHRFLLESWVSFPSVTPQEEVLTIKLNYVLFTGK
jgi:hypothetical protein